MVLSWLCSVKYRNITGLLHPILLIYTTNLFTVDSGSDVFIDQLDVMLVNDGSAKLYAHDAVIRLSNSIISGPLGLGILGADNGAFVIRNLTIISTTPCSRLVRRSPDSTFNVDTLVLTDVSVTDYLWAASPGSTVHMQKMVLINVTTPSVIQGWRFEFTVEEMLIQNSTLRALVSSAISA